MSSIELYERKACPYCTNVRNKLEELGIDYESHIVPKPHSERTEVEEISGQTGVPVLVDEEHGVEGMHESDEIIAYLEETYGDGAA